VQKDFCNNIGHKRPSTPLSTTRAIGVTFDQELPAGIVSFRRRWCSRRPIILKIQTISVQAHSRGRRNIMTRHTTLLLTGMALLGVATAAWPQRGFAQSTASVPDISGTWVYPFCCGFKPPVSGPGPVINTARRRQALGADYVPLPAGASAPLASDVSRFVGDYTNPILKPQAAEAVKKHGEIEASAVPYPTPRNQCWPEGVPFFLLIWECRCSSSRTRSRSFMSTITKSAMCA
jgi:hypothetical protein